MLFDDPVVCDVCRLLLLTTIHPPEYWDEEPYIDSAVAALQHELHVKWRQRAGERIDESSRPPFRVVKKEQHDSGSSELEIRLKLKELEEQGRLSAAIASLVIRLRREGIDEEQVINWLRSVTDGPHGDNEGK